MARNLDNFFHDLEENSAEMKKPNPNFDLIHHRYSNSDAAALLVRVEILQKNYDDKGRVVTKQLGAEKK